MAIYEIDSDNTLFYDYTEPTATSHSTFVFFNPLTGDSSIWQNTVTKPLLEAGHGVLVYNMRGQLDSAYSDGINLDQALIVSDAKRLLEHIAPANPIFVGLSIGGLYAAWAATQGVECAGLVFLNTLRRDGPRLQWISDILVRLVETGGAELLRDTLSPLIMNEEWQGKNRPDFLKDTAYTPIDRNSGTYNLLTNACNTDWNLPYEKLTMPVLVVTGLQDRVFRDPQDIDTLFARLPNARKLDLQNAGHMIPVEQPESLLDALFDMAGRCKPN